MGLLAWIEEGSYINVVVVSCCRNQALILLTYIASEKLIPGEVSKHAHCNNRLDGAGEMSMLIVLPLYEG